MIAGNGRGWTDEEIQVLKDNYANKLDKELMDLLPRRSLRSIKSKRLDLGLSKDRGNTLTQFYGWTKEQDKFLVKNYNDMTDGDIANVIGKNKQSVSARRYKLGLRKYRNARSKRLSEKRSTLPKKQRIRVLLSAAYYVDQCTSGESISCECKNCKKAREISAIFDYPERYNQLKNELVNFK